jgi:toxin ParE1/3/4
MRVRFSKLALAELDAILADIRANNPGTAARLNERVGRVVGRIAQFPDGAQQVDTRPGVRRVPLVRYPYVIYYTIIEGDVMILRFLHGARRSPWE